MKIRNSALITLAAATLSITVMAPAHATTEIDEDLIEKLESHGVSEERQNSIDALTTEGETLDAEIPGVEPTGFVEFEESGFDATRYDYPDGSYQFTLVEQPVQHIDENEVSPSSVGTCSSSTPGNWQVRTNCTIGWVTASFNFSHKMDARWTTGSQGTGQIDDVWGPSAAGAIVPSSASVSLIRSTGTIGTPALSQGRVSGAT